MIEWFTRNHVAANLLMVVIVVAGLIAASDVREEMVPEFELDRISISVAYLGAAPEEVESAVAVRVRCQINPDQRACFVRETSCRLTALRGVQKFSRLRSASVLRLICSRRARIAGRRPA